MHKYTITGRVVDAINRPVKNLLIQVMDSDQKWYEDRNDDLLESQWVKEDGTFEIFLDTESFKDSLFEGTPEFYLIIRNSLGQIIHITDPNKDIRKNDNSGNQNSIHFEISLTSAEKEIPIAPIDPYMTNNGRIISAFQRLGDVSEFQLNDISRILRLLTTSVNTWSLYTTDYTWEFTGYDGPQVPRYPWRVPGHSHKLSWEKESV
jgi:hypothetical protein